ncbi:MAG: aminodeoxychorismate lyase [Methylococcales bacterium]
MGCSTLINGKPVSVIDISDRGLQYGDGVFETIAVSHGQPEFLVRHLQRLQAGCQALGIECPQHHLLSDEIHMLCSQQHSGVVKIQITSGQSARGYRRPGPLSPNRIITCQASPEHSQQLYTSGIKLRLCRQRLSINPALAGIKHLNRLEQVIGRNEWNSADIHEAVMLDTDGYVIEGTMSNLFFVANGCLKTALLDRAGVAGIIRSVVIDQAKQAGVVVDIKRIKLNELLNADEVFMTNSVIGVWPVRQLETRAYQVGPTALQAQNWVTNASDRFAT